MPGKMSSRWVYMFQPMPAESTLITSNRPSYCFRAATTSPRGSACIHVAKDDPWAITNHQNRLIFTGTGNVEPGPQFLSIAGEANANRGVALLALLKPRQRD